MDPNETLAALQRLALETEAPEPWADYFDALDGWLRSGGFLPDAWRKPQEEAIRAVIAGDEDDSRSLGDWLTLLTGLRRPNREVTG